MVSFLKPHWEIAGNTGRFPMKLSRFIKVQGMVLGMVGNRYHQVLSGLVGHGRGPRSPTRPLFTMKGDGFEMVQNGDQSMPDFHANVKRGGLGTFLMLFGCRPLDL